MGIEIGTSFSIDNRDNVTFLVHKRQLAQALNEQLFSKSGGWWPFARQKFADMGLMRSNRECVLNWEILRKSLTFLLHFGEMLTNAFLGKLSQTHPPHLYFPNFRIVN